MGIRLGCIGGKWLDIGFFFKGFLLTYDPKACL
jgi:hypothetical protein